MLLIYNTIYSTLLFPPFHPPNSKFIFNIKKHKVHSFHLNYKVVELCYTNIIIFT
jgi:hypothetical protein